MKITKKRVFICVMAVSVAVAAGIGIKRRNSKEKIGVTVNTKAVEVKKIEEILSLKAPLEGTESIDVVSRLHCEVLSIDVKEGDKVHKDQVLATLDTSTLEDEIEKLKDNLELLKIQYSKDEESQNNSLELAKAKLNDNLQESQRNYEQALETLKNAENDLKNAKVLNEAGGMSSEEVKTAQTKVNEAQRAVDKFNVENGKVVATESELLDIKNSKTSSSQASTLKSIEIAKKELERKKKDLEECRIKSSIDGTVTRVNSKVGRFADEVEEDKPMFVIENIDKLKMMVNVSEYDIDKVAVGQTVTINADILKDDVANGVVVRISPTGEEKSGSTERFIPTQIDITSGYDRLIAGINANAKIQIAKADNAKVIPIEALRDNNDGTYSVLRVNAQNKLETVAVEIGIEDALEIQVISDNLNEGDKIVLNPDDTMKEGMSVMVNE